MKQEIIDWYSEREYQPAKMFKVGSRWGHSRNQIEVAMVHCYNKIVNEGKKISDCDVARYVKNVCREADDTKYTQKLKDLYESEDKLKEYKRIAFSIFTIGLLLNALLWFFYLNWR